MKLLFWLSVAFVLCTYGGYPLWIYLRASFRAKPVHPAPITPEVSIIVAVYNGAGDLPKKLKNLFQLDYPLNLLEIIFVSDGSTDETARILSAQATERVRILISDEHRGKAAALNQGIREARAKVLFFTDVRQVIAPDALRNMVSNLADPAVGCVSGELLLGGDAVNPSSEGMGLYWNLEKKIRRWEAMSNSSVGATGAIYLTRRDLTPEVPEGTILDDLYIPLEIARRGARVIFEPRAVAWDQTPEHVEKEFRRKVRTLLGNYQILCMAPWVLSKANPLRFEFICHKLLRLLVPFALISTFFTSILLSGGLYRAAFDFQVLICLLAGLAALKPRLGLVNRLASASLTFLVLNAAAAVALFYFVSGKKQVWA